MNLSQLDGATIGEWTVHNNPEGYLSLIRPRQSDQEVVANPGESGIIIQRRLLEYEISGDLLDPKWGDDYIEVEWGPEPTVQYLTVMQAWLAENVEAI